jgi:hypothetical protein
MNDDIERSVELDVTSSYYRVRVIQSFVFPILSDSVNTALHQVCPGVFFLLSNAFWHLYSSYK